MKTIKHLAAVLGTVLALSCVAVALLNVLVDPFGVFGDPIFHWDAYGITLAPGVGKIEALERRSGQFDSFILGGPSAAALPVSGLNERLDADFYNLSMGDDGMDGVEELARYVIDSQNAKHILLVVSLDSVAGGGASGPRHYRLNGGSRLGFYIKSLFANPRYALQKVRDRQNDTIMADTWDLYDPQTGSLGARVSDTEPIAGLQSYLAQPEYQSFASPAPLELTDIAGAVENVARVKTLCEAAGVDLTVIVPPVYAGRITETGRGEASEFCRALAAVTPFWDFSLSSVSRDPRYFYDPAAFRPCVGDMMEARVCGDDGVYVPEDFGVYVTGENAGSLDARYDAVLDDPTDPEALTCRVPVLIYHTVLPDGGEGFTASQFEEQLIALSEAGYTAVSFDELQDYVYHGAQLPEKSVVITFDDGYYSNYQYAYPLLCKYNMKATIFVIGVSVGHMEFYKDTDFALTPHFGEAEMAEMSGSGLVSIQSHTYDMHQWPPFELGDHIRETVSRFPDESEEAFVEAVKSDLQMSREGIERVTGEAVDALAWPEGIYDPLSQRAANESGFQVTVSTNHGVNTLVRGLPQCLSSMYRIYSDAFPTAADLIEVISGL